MVGALFCSECGSQLALEESEASNKTVAFPDWSTREENRVIVTQPENPAMGPSPMISLSILNTGQRLAVLKREELTLGRISEGQSILPDIDLTPFLAYESGVSRLHASIRIKESQVSITDLDSANGTLVNGKRIGQYVPYPLSHGDILALGKLRIQVHIQA